MPRRPAANAVKDPKPAEPEAPAVDGVLVVKTTDEQGNIATDTQALGAVQATEVQTVLELGLAGWRRKIGLDS